MDKITITREEFRQRITENPRGFSIVRAMKEEPEKYSDSSLMTQLLQEMTQKITLMEVEEELFGPEDESHDD